MGLELFRRCWSSFDIVLDAYVGAKATCNVPEHVARSLEHSDCKSKAPVMRREEHDDERLNFLGHVSPAGRFTLRARPTNLSFESKRSPQ